MGRKVHPVGFRLKIIRDWDARWFAEGEQYADLLHEDLAIRDLVRESSDRMQRSLAWRLSAFTNQVQVTIWTAKPGVVIGRKGASVKELRRKMEELTKKKVRVEVEEIEKPDLDAYLVAENIASQLERRISHGRAMKRAIGQAMRQGAEGSQDYVQRPASGAEMARREWQMEGRVPRNTLRANIDYGISRGTHWLWPHWCQGMGVQGRDLGDKSDRQDVYVS